MSPESRYWFPAKRRGWGWGPPATWQGRVFLVLWVASLAVLSPFIVMRSLGWYLGFVGLMVCLLFAVCLAKGEPPKWRN